MNILELDDTAANLAYHLKGITPEEVAHMAEVDLVDLGVAIKHMQDALAKAMVPVKETLRDMAQAVDKGQPGARIYHGTQGATVVVTVQALKGKIKAGANTDTLDRLTPTFFESKTTYKARRGLLKLANTADEETAGLLASVIDIASDAPRVSFK